VVVGRRVYVGAVAAIGAAVAVAAGCRHEPAPAAPARRPDRVLAEFGAELFHRHCAACHGEEGRGDGPVASELRTPPADLTRIAARRGGVFPDGEIARYIDGRFEVAAHGTRAMPIWGERFGISIPESGVSEEVVRGRIAVLIEYLRTLQRTP
jgi:mono/diheme cytochrome c family protein